MAAGLTDHPWTIAELVQEALAAEPCDCPEPVALMMPTERAGRPLGASRALPGGGFLRAVTDDAPKAKGAPVAPAPSPETPPAAPALAVVEPPPESPQMDLFAWKPRPRETVQLSLFGLDFDPGPMA